MSRWSQALVSSLLVATLAQAQDVYVTDGKNGPLYSDRPLPGAREVALPPLSEIFIRVARGQPDE